MSDPKYPDVKVPLVGRDGNAFSILGRVEAALRRGGVGGAERAAFVDEATSGDYNHLLRTVTKWVDATGGPDDE